jgi:hypothetical protein
MKKEKIIADERYHTCGRCKWKATPDDSYPCNSCIYGFDERKDLWEYDGESEEVE